MWKLNAETSGPSASTVGSRGAVARMTALGLALTALATLCATQEADGAALTEFEGVDRPNDVTIERTIPEIIDAAAVEFHQSPEVMKRVAWCESSYRPAVVGDGGLAVGLFQFHPDTWSEASRFLGYTEDLRADPVAASRVAAYMWSQ